MAIWADILFFAFLFRASREILRGMPSGGSNADVCNRRDFRVVVSAFTPEQTDHSGRARYPITYEYRYSLMPDADATENIPRSRIPVRGKRRYLYLLMPR